LQLQQSFEHFKASDECVPNLTFLFAMFGQIGDQGTQQVRERDDTVHDFFPIFTIHFRNKYEPTAHRITSPITIHAQMFAEIILFPGIFLLRGGGRHSSRSAHQYFVRCQSRRGDFTRKPKSITPSFQTSRTRPCLQRMSSQVTTLQVI